MPAAPNPCPGENCSHVPPPPLPISRPALALAAQLCQHQWHCTRCVLRLPASTPKLILFVSQGFGLGFPRPGPELLSRLPCEPAISCREGRKIQKWQETAGKVAAKSWEVMEKTRLWDLGKRTDWWSAPRSAISVPGEVWLQHVQCPERAGLNAFCSMHRATLCPSGSKSWQWTCSFYFCPHIHLPQCQLTLFLPSCTPAAQTTAGKAPRWVCSPSLPCSSSLRKFKLLIFRFF